MTTTMNQSNHEIRQERHQAFETIEAVTAAVSRSLEMSDHDRLGVVAGTAAEKFLLLGKPGEGKTLIARTMAAAMGGEFRRHQGTPDTMPADITGYPIFNQETRHMEFQRGPVLSAHVFLADELNRNTPKAQSAFLEVMEEGQVSYNGKAIKALSPMTFIATQNPEDVEQGTYPLPVAQLDRFAFSLSPQYDDQAQSAIFDRYLDPRSQTEQVVDLIAIAGLRSAIKKIEISRDMRNEIMAFKSRIENTKGIDQKRSIVGNRVVQSTANLARFHAISRGKEVENVNREDIAFAHALAYPHRIRLTTEKIREGYTPTLATHQIIKAAA